MRLSPKYAVIFVLGTGLMVTLTWITAGAQTPGGDTAKQRPARPLPKDVFPDSRNRLPLPKREDLDEEGRKAYDAAVSDPRLLAGLQGPAGIRLYSPRAGASNKYLRFETALGRRLSELAILVAARELDQQFEWTAHQPEARKQGVEENVIDKIGRAHV